MIDLNEYQCVNYLRPQSYICQWSYNSCVNILIVTTSLRLSTLTDRMNSSDKVPKFYDKSWAKNVWNTCIFYTKLSGFSTPEIFLIIHFPVLRPKSPGRIMSIPRLLMTWRHQDLRRCRINYYSDVIISAMASEITASQLLALDRLFECRSKKMSKVPRHCPLWGESTGHWRILLAKGQ